MKISEEASAKGLDNSTPEQPYRQSVEYAASLQANRAPTPESFLKRMCIWAEHCRLEHTRRIVDEMKRQ